MSLVDVHMEYSAVLICFGFTNRKARSRATCPRQANNKMRIFKNPDHMEGGLINNCQFHSHFTEKTLQRSSYCYGIVIKLECKVHVGESWMLPIKTIFPPLHSMHPKLLRPPPSVWEEPRRDRGTSPPWLRLQKQGEVREWINSMKLRRNQLYQHLDFSPTRPIQDIWAPGPKITHSCVFKPWRLWFVGYHSQRKPRCHPSWARQTVRNWGCSKQHKPSLLNSESRSRMRKQEPTRTLNKFRFGGAVSKQWDFCSIWGQR